MTHSPVAFGLSARVARREVCRRPWRTLLIALLVALPVAGMTLGAVMARTERLSGASAWKLNYGSADAIVRGADIKDTGVVVPSGSTTTVGRTANFQLLRTTAGVRSRAVITDLSPTAPVVANVITLDKGRLPSAANEVLLSDSAARDLGAHIGDALPLDRPSSRTVVVTGIGHFADDISQRLALVPQGSDMLGVSPDVFDTTTYIQLPAAMSAADREAWARAARSTAGLIPSPVAFPDLQSAGGNADAAVRWTWVIGGLVLTVAGIVITSAFASGARRQLTTLGQLAANGAGPRVLRRTLLLQGTWTGIAGSIAGLGLGFASLAIINPYRERIFNRDSMAYVLRPIDLVPIVVMGVIATTIAALVPARTTSRIPVLAALAGRRPLGRVPRGLTLGGIISVAAGLGLLGLAVLGSTGNNTNGGSVWTATAVLGGVGVLLGASAVAPALVGVLEPIASRLHGPWRFAARSLVRQRTRTGGVVSAVCATSALAVMASALVLGSIAGDDAERASARDNEVQLVSQQTTSQPTPVAGFKTRARAPEGIAVPTPDALLAAMIDAVPSLQTIHTTVVDPGSASADQAQLPGPPGVRTPAIADASTIDAYRLNDAAKRALLQTGAIYLDDSTNDTPPQTVALGGSTVDLVKVHANLIGLLPHIVISPALAAELHLSTMAGPTILRSPHALTRHEQDLLSEIRDDQTTIANSASEGTFILTGVAIFSASGAPPPFVLEALLSGIALVFALFVVAASLALAAAETRDERDVLAVIGAAPTTMRRTSAHKAVLLSVLGAALAIPVGFLPVVVFTAADRSSTPFLVFPWRTVTMLLIVVPALIGLFTTAASSLALRLRPVRTSTMTFE